MAKPKGPKKSNGEALTASVATPSVAVEKNGGNGGESLMAAAKKSTRKPSIVKSDVRATIVPINVDDEIRRLAYLLSESRGFEPGHETEDWLTAEREVRQRYHQHRA